MTELLEKLIALEVAPDLIALKTKAIFDVRQAMTNDTPENRAQANETLAKLQAALGK